MTERSCYDFHQLGEAFLYSRSFKVPHCRRRSDFTSKVKKHVSFFVYFHF